MVHSFRFQISSFVLLICVGLAVVYALAQAGDRQVELAQGQGNSQIKVSVEPLRKKDLEKVVAKAEPDDAYDGPPPPDEPTVTYATAIVAGKQSMIRVEYEVEHGINSDGKEDFPPFNFEPIGGDTVFSNSGVEYRVFKRSFGWAGEPRKSKPEFKIFLLVVAAAKER